MTDTAAETIDGAAPSQFDTLAPEPATLPPIGTDEPVTPDHTAANDAPAPEQETGPERITPRERVRRARERMGGGTTPGPAARPETRAGSGVGPAVKSVTDAKLRKALTQVYVTIGLAAMPFDPTCSNVVMLNAEKCADSLVVAAQTNPAIRRALIALTETGAWGGVMIAHLPIIAAVAWHHSPSQGVRDTIGPLAAAVAGIDTVALQAQMNAEETHD